MLGHVNAPAYPNPVVAPDVVHELLQRHDAARAAHRVMDIFAAADLSDPVMAALFDQVLGYRSA